MVAPCFQKNMDLEYTFEKTKLDPFSAGFVHSKPVLGVPRFGSGWDACFHRHGGGETMMHSCNIVLHFVSPSIAGEQRFRRSMKQINLKICRGWSFHFCLRSWKTRGRTCLAAPPPTDAPVVPGENLWRPRQRAVVDLQAGYLWED